MATNVVVPLTVLTVGGALVYVGITNPEGGGFAGIARAIRGESPRKAAANPSAFAATAADLAALGTKPRGGRAGGIAPTAAVAASGSRAAVIRESATWLGVPYSWGGNTKAGVDCSGLTTQVYKTVGVNLPRVSAAQAVTGARRTAATAQPGDLVFFGVPAHHVGIYLGGGNLRHAPHTGSTVRDEPIWRGEIVTYRDVLGTTKRRRKRKRGGAVAT